MSEISCQAKVNQGFKLMSKAWFGSIIYALKDQDLCFNQISAQIEGISNKVLSQRLKEMEELKIIERKLAPQGSQVLYGLAPWGKEALAATQSVHDWVEKAPDDVAKSL